MTADLHCHTKLSDGSTGIDELMILAKKTGINVLAVTDHDTFAGSKRAKIIGQRYGINVITAVELTSFDYKRGKEEHILCYMCEAPDRLEGLCKRISEKRREFAAAALQRLMRFYPISPELVSSKAQGSTNVFKNHIIQAVMDSGYSMPYGIMFEKLFGANGAACFKTQYPDVSEVIEHIHEAGGLAVLAHPSKIDAEALDDFVESGLDGVEVWHPKVNKEVREELEAVATDRGLITTGGSDFHGMYTSVARPLGSYVTPESQIEEMKRRKEKICKRI